MTEFVRLVKLSESGAQALVYFIGVLVLYAGATNAAQNTLFSFVAVFGGVYLIIRAIE